MDGLLRVTPEQLITTSNEFSNKASTIGSLTTEVMNLFTGLSGGWEGEGATAYITRFKGLDEDIQKLTRMIQEHSTDLNEMAEAYKKAESQVVEMAQSLSSDVIV